MKILLEQFSILGPSKFFFNKDGPSKVLRTIGPNRKLVQ